MRLADLNPNWLSHGGHGCYGPDDSKRIASGPLPRRDRIGVGFDCPCGCGERVDILFATPPDGGPAISTHAWQNSGHSFEDLTLAPSILCGTPCKWHGFVRNGEIVPA